MPTVLPKPSSLLFVATLLFSCAPNTAASSTARPRDGRRSECSLLQAANTSMDPAETEALFQVMEAVSSDRDWRASSPDPCSPGSSWPGLECTQGRDGRLHVARLDFGTPLNPTCKKAAVFPPELFDLPYLQSLFFFDCFRTQRTSLSAASALMNRAAALQQLSLKSNPALMGSIPAEISSLSSLQILTLSQNHLQGQIPESISAMTSLVHLDLSYNSLTGTIPTQLGNLRNLVGLDLSYNQLTGPMPASIGRMGALQKLDLCSNSLAGAVPESLVDLGSLSFLALSNNKLRGPFPRGLPKLGNLQYFIMDGNPMSVELPPQLGRLAKLQELRLADSGYWGHIPESFGGLGNLTTLSLQDNRLTGGIPAGLGGLGRIYHLNLSQNMLGGVVPFGAGFLKRLGRNLDMSGNPGLCLNGSEGVESVKIGVGVCEGGGNAPVVAQPAVTRSEGPLPAAPRLSNMVVGLLGMWGLLHQPWPLICVAA